jgi:hypothetical protein
MRYVSKSSRSAGAAAGDRPGEDSTSKVDPSIKVRWRAERVEANPGLWCAYGLFAAGLILSICAVRLQVGPLPIRSILMLASLGMLVLSNPQLVAAAIGRSARLLWLIGLVAVLAVAVSLLNRLEPGSLVQQLVEIHFQALTGVILAYALAMGLGIRKVGLAFILAFLISAVFALGQAAGIDFAWQARAMIGSWMNDPPVNQAYYLRRERGLGLSFSSIHFATQACLAFSAYFAIRLSANRGRLVAHPKIIAALVLAIFLCMATGNRSPILGFLVFAGVWSAVAMPRATLLILPILVLLAAAAIPLMDILADHGLRIASRDDGSAEGRETLRAFGMFLFERRPWGYGLGFDSTRYWPLFAHESIYMPNVLAMREFTLHNYYLMVLNKYGFGLLVLLPLVIPKTRVALAAWLAFLPYAVHIYYHNDGPFQGDFLIWFVIPLYGLLGQQLRESGNEQPLQSSEPPRPRWRRSRVGTEQG